MLWWFSLQILRLCTLLAMPLLPLSFVQLVLFKLYFYYKPTSLNYILCVCVFVCACANKDSWGGYEPDVHREVPLFYLIRKIRYFADPTLVSAQFSTLTFYSEENIGQWTRTIGKGNNWPAGQFHCMSGSVFWKKNTLALEREPKR